MRTSTRVLCWIPRILVILAILFLSLFALDSFSPQLTFWQNITSFLIHLIPSFILTGILIFAWKHEKTGGIIFTIFGLAFSIFIFIINFRRTSSLGLSLLIGAFSLYSLYSCGCLVYCKLL